MVNFFIILTSQFFKPFLELRVSFLNSVFFGQGKHDVFLSVFVGFVAAMREYV